MPKYFCDYCDTHLTHDSPSVRKTHNSGRKHKEAVKLYYMNWLEQEAQNMMSHPGGGFPPRPGFMVPMPGMMPPGMVHPPMGMPPHPGMMPPPPPGMMPPPPHGPMPPPGMHPGPPGGGMGPPGPPPQQQQQPKN